MDNLEQVKQIAGIWELDNQQITKLLDQPDPGQVITINDAP
jgi:hypothetical protein